MKWVTRSHVHVDRAACPWLITRFVDSDAEFLFVPGAFGGAFLWMIDPRVNLLAAFAFGLLGTTWFAARGRDLE